MLKLKNTTLEWSRVSMKGIEGWVMLAKENDYEHERFHFPVASGLAQSVKYWVGPLVTVGLTSRNIGNAIKGGP
jgi:hypothetical protein